MVDIDLSSPAAHKLRLGFEAVAAAYEQLSDEAFRRGDMEVAASHKLFAATYSAYAASLLAAVTAYDNAVRRGVQNRGAVQ